MIHTITLLVLGALIIANLVVLINISNNPMYNAMDKYNISDDELTIFLTPRLFSRDLMLDDPVDFINGFNLALAFIYRMYFNDTNEEAKFRISLAMWLKQYIDNMEKLDWR